MKALGVPPGMDFSGTNSIRRGVTERMLHPSNPSGRCTPEASSQTAMETLGVVALALLGAREPHIAATAIAACFEGLVLHRIARHDPTDPRPILELVIKAALA